MCVGVLSFYNFENLIVKMYVEHVLSHQRPFFNSPVIDLQPWEQESYCTFCFVGLHFAINFPFLPSDQNTQNAWLEALTNYLYKEKEVASNSINGVEFCWFNRWRIKFSQLSRAGLFKVFSVIAVNIIEFYCLILIGWIENSARKVLAVRL